MAIEFYLNGAACDPPDDWASLELEISFENNSPAASLKNTTFDFVGSNATLINTWINSGGTGGVGIFEGIPFMIKACNNITIFDGVLDLTNAGNYFSCDICTVAIRQTNSIDWLNDVADSFTFAYLASNQITGAAHITTSDYVAVSYVLNQIPNYPNVILFSLSIIVMIREFKAAVLECRDIVNKMIFSVNSDLVWWVIILTILVYLLEIILIIAYIVAIIAALIDLMQSLFDNLIQLNKYKYGMKVSTLFEKACANLGLNFSSTILQTSPFKELVIIPQKYIIKKIGGIPSFRDDVDDSHNAKAYGYFDGTFGDLIRAMNDVFNAKVTIINNTLHFEVFDNFQNISSYVLPDIDIETFQTNASELTSNYYLDFKTDNQDLNTYDFFNKTNAQCIFTPNIQINSKNLLLKNLTSKNLVFATAKRKTEFTEVEKMYIYLSNFFSAGYSGIYDLFQHIVDNQAFYLQMFTNIPEINQLIVITNPLANYPSVGQLFNIPDRIGAMLLENDFIGNQRLLLVEQGTHSTYVLSANNDTYVNAEYLLKNFHNNSFIVDIPTNKHNQYYKYKGKKIPFCCKDYTQFLLSNYIKTFDGQLAKVLSLKWTPELEEATIDFDVKKKYTNNIKQKYIVDGVEI